MATKRRTSKGRKSKPQEKRQNAKIDFEATVGCLDSGSFIRTRRGLYKRPSKGSEPALKSACFRTFDVTELLESILKLLSIQDICICKGVNRHFKKVIDGSIELQRLTFMAHIQERADFDNRILVDYPGKTIVKSTSRPGDLDIREMSRTDRWVHQACVVNTLAVRADDSSKRPERSRSTQHCAACGIMERGHTPLGLMMLNYADSDLKPEASIRNMFLTQPPSTKLWWPVRQADSREFPRLEYRFSRKGFTLGEAIVIAEKEAPLLKKRVHDFGLRMGLDLFVDWDEFEALMRGEKFECPDKTSKKLKWE